MTSNGLYCIDARWYDPSVGRFITQDSYTGSQSDPMSMNRYIYARDDPERYTDPSGHSYGRMFTDYNDPDYVPGSTVVTCSGGACTITNTDVSGGYYSQISTTYGSTTDSSGTTTTAFSTTSTDTYPSGTSTTTIWSAATMTSPSEKSTYKSSVSKYGVVPASTRTSCSFVLTPIDTGQFGVPSGIDVGIPNGIPEWAYFFETTFGPIPFPFGMAAEPVGNCGPPHGAF